MVIFPLAPDQTIAQIWSNGARGREWKRNHLLWGCALVHWNPQHQAVTHPPHTHGKNNLQTNETKQEKSLHMDCKIPKHSDNMTRYLTIHPSKCGWRNI